MYILLSISVMVLNDMGVTVKILLFLVQGVYIILPVRDFLRQYVLLCHILRLAVSRCFFTLPSPAFTVLINTKTDASEAKKAPKTLFVRSVFTVKYSLALDVFFKSCAFPARCTNTAPFSKTNGPWFLRFIPTTLSPKYWDKFWPMKPVAPVMWVKVDMDQK